MKKEKKNIFIHSLFRTGSTYIWNKFRENPGYYCYYEPFHQVLAEINPKNIEHALTKNYRQVGHPLLSRYYLYEYAPLLENGRNGVPFFKKSFSFDGFCHNEENPDLKQYIDHLIKNAGEKIPLFQFNRSALRVKWFKENYPGSLNIYLVRNPRDQWQSYIDLYKKNNYITFFVMDLLIAGINHEKEYFQPLAKYLPLINYNNDHQKKEEDFYRIILDSYSEEERYLIFYYTWLRSLVENVLHADLVVNINLLSQKQSYRTSLKKLLLAHGIHGIEFEDAKIKEYPSYSLAKPGIKKIQETARKIIVQALNEDQINLFFQKISEEDRKYLLFTKHDFYKKRKTKIRYNIREKTIEKFRNMLFLTFNQFLQQKKETEILKTALHQNAFQVTEKLKEKEELLKDLEARLSEKEHQLKQKDNYIHSILDSYSYKTGQILLSPFIAIKHLVKKDRKKLPRAYKTTTNKGEKTGTAAPKEKE